MSPSPVAATPGPPAFSATASVTVFGSLAWIGLVWAGAAVVFAVILAGVVTWGELDASLWHELGAGMQRWLFLAVGYTMVTEFGRMFLVNGVTRAQLNRSVLAALGVLCVCGGVVAMIGYLGEGLVFDRYGWTQRLDDGRIVDGAADLLPVFGEQVLTLAAFFTSGWLIGAWYRSQPKDEAFVWAVPSLLPALAAQLLVRGDTFFLGFLERFDIGTAPLVGAAVAVVVTAIGVVVATRVTREIAPSV